MISGNTPLMYAIYNDSAEDLIALLVKAGASVRVVSSDGSTPLIMAAYYGSESLVSYFLKAGVPVNATDDEGKTALMRACEELEDPAAVLSLLAAGADASPVDEEGKSARDYALENEYFGDDGALLERLASPLSSL